MSIRAVLVRVLCKNVDRFFRLFISRQLRYKRALRASQTYSLLSPILRLSYQWSVARINNLYLIIYRLIALCYRYDCIAVIVLKRNERSEASARGEQVKRSFEYFAAWPQPVRRRARDPMTAPIAAPWKTRVSFAGWGGGRFLRHVRCLHYFDIIIPEALYLAARCSFCKSASGAGVLRF